MITKHHANNPGFGRAMIAVGILLLIVVLVHW